MTSWLRDSPLRVSLGRRRAPSPLHDVDPAAAFQSFIIHWQQTCEIIDRTRLRGQVRLEHENLCSLLLERCSDIVYDFLSMLVIIFTVHFI